MQDIKRLSTVLPYVMALGILFIDSLTPLGYVEWILYALPIIILSVSAGRKQFYIFISLCCTFIILGAFVSPRGNVPLSLPIFDRSIGILTIISGSMLLRSLLNAKADINLLNRTKEAIKLEKDLLQAIMNSAGDSHLVYLDPDFNFVRVNDTYAKSCGYRPEEMIGKNHFALYPHAENEAIFARVRDSGVAEKYHDKPFVFPDQPQRGTTYWDWTLIPVKNYSGTVKGLVFSLVETTDRKRMEEEIKKRVTELAEANAELDSFAHSVSHDLRNPLRAIQGFCTIIQKDYADAFDSQCREYFQRIVTGTEKMDALINDMLILSKISRQEMVFQDIDLSAIALSVINDLRQTEPEREVKSVIMENCKARGDVQLMTIALSNLIGNAWKYSGKTVNAKIEFGATEKKGETVYFVRDNGAGFDMQHAQKLFAPFKRMHSDNQFPGTGIGLSIVLRVIQRHGGRIWAESEVNKGATFFFTLPEPRK